ncbi:Hypothetical predicted protein [Mytilus galloprovincialis]|uniref:Ig-like domain-containing protein n=1 Tax=Mytilus galloprovincialis TaxID=29158 RepID=A0A8B6BXF7_MYTGA|nr:Hypothetical predicted protein [Mytilus galloprovincialis]
MSVHRHDNMTLECAFVSLTDITSFKWIKHVKNVQTVLNETTHPDKFSVSLSGSSRNVLLFKSDFILEDAGTYQCIVSNENGENDDNVTVLIYEEIPNPQVTSKIYPLNLGGDVHLECMIDVYPEVTDVWWMKDDGLIDITDSRYSGSVPEKPSLNISMPTTDDIGYYRCCANNSIGFNCSNNTILGYTPFIINSTDYAEGFIGKSLHVNCEVKSVPKILDVTLQPKGTIFNSDVSNISTGNHRTKFTFMITDPTLQDSGNYTCNATNVHTSSISDTIKLEIYDQSDKHITFGERIIIDCAVESHPAITKSTEITWSLNGSCVNTKNIIKYKQPTPTSLTINNATFGDQGEYTCAVEKDMINGTSGGFLITVNGGKATGGTLDNPNITFTSVEKSDEGNYTCYVTNAVGKRAGNSVYIQVNESMCPCLCSFKQKLEFWKNKNFTKEEMLEYMAPFLKKTLEEMKLEQNKLSKNIRKRTSAKDDRTSSQQIGLVGIVFIAATFGVIIVFDIIAIKRYLLNIREAFNRV